MRVPSATPTDRIGIRPTVLGRETELHALLATLARPDVRLVTLTGPGGIGKTTLANTAIDGRPDATFVDASAASNPDELTERLVAILGWEQRGQSAARRLQARLPGHHGLLVLDNLEQIQGADECLGQWLNLAPHVRFLVTSREALGLPAEHVQQLHPLALPAQDAGSEADVRLAPAGELFLRHSRRVNPDFAVNAEMARDVARLCGHLDGLPLAIELAASRMDLFTPGAALKWLEDGRLLPGVRRAGSPERQHSVEQAVRWSYDLLTPGHQLAFRQLGVFAGDFGVPAAAAVLELNEDDALGVLRDLERKSLVRSAATEGRYVLLETVRAASLKLLRESGDAHSVRMRHARHYARLAGQLGVAFRSDPSRTSVALGTELHEVRCALQALTGITDGSTTELAQRMSTDLGDLLYARGLQTETRSWLTLALQMPHGTTLSRALCRGKLGALIAIAQDHDTADALLSEALAEARTAGNTPDLNLLLYWYGSNLWRSGRMDEALVTFREALELAERYGPQNVVHAVLSETGTILRIQQDDAGAVEYLERAASLAARHGDLAAQGITLNSLGIAHSIRGRKAQALEAFEGAFEAMRGAGDAGNQMYALLNIAYVALDLGQHDEVRSRLDEALAHAGQYFDTQDVQAVAAVRELYALALLDEGSVGEAHEHVTKAIRIYRQLGAARRTAFAQGILAAALVANGEAGSAARLLLSALPELAFNPRDAARHAFNLLTVARVAWQLQLHEEAVWALARSKLHLQQADTNGHVGRQHAHLASTLREHLGDPRFDSAWHEGPTVEQERLLAAIERALHGSGSPCVSLPSDEDRQLLALLASGLTNREIAVHLGLSPHTVRNRLSRLYAQHGVAGREELLDLARQRGWLQHA